MPQTTPPQGRQRRAHLNSACCAALMMTWPHRSPRSATASAACSRRSIPRLTRVVGPRLEHAAVAELLMRHPSPAQLSARGEKRLSSELQKLAPRLYKRLARDIMQALSEQTVVVPGTASAALVLPRLCAQPPACAISALTSAPRSSSGLPPTLFTPS